MSPLFHNEQNILIVIVMIVFVSLKLQLLIRIEQKRSEQDKQMTPRNLQKGLEFRRMILQPY
ncbi:hypothetical protein pb186bvf_007227 [Paramecium bursaria]